AYYRLFEKLHHDTFKHDVMTAEEIIESLDSHNKLFIFMSEGLLKGYLYLQVFENTKKAEIKYFSSHTDYRFMGIAFDLLSYALQY
ncbi:N-acetyltransferase, partial [Staphylococcus epidermidis]